MAGDNFAASLSEDVACSEVAPPAAPAAVVGGKPVASSSSGAARSGGGGRKGGRGRKVGEARKSGGACSGGGGRGTAAPTADGDNFAASLSEDVACSEAAPLAAPAAVVDGKPVLSSSTQAAPAVAGNELAASLNEDVVRSEAAPPAAPAAVVGGKPSTCETCPRHRVRLMQRAFVRARFKGKIARHYARRGGKSTAQLAAAMFYRRRVTLIEVEGELKMDSLPEFSKNRSREYREQFSAMAIADEHPTLRVVKERAKARSASAQTKRKWLTSVEPQWNSLRLISEGAPARRNTQEVALTTIDGSGGADGAQTAAVIASGGSRRDAAPSVALAVTTCGAKAPVALGAPPGAASVISSRSGGASALWDAGTTAEEIKPCGRWSSDCYQICIWPGHDRPRGVAAKMLGSSLSLMAPLATYRRQKK